jgi:hypothetical protein
MNAENDIVIAYDGSDNARRAITVAAGQIGPRHADVVHVWEPLASASSRLAIYAPMSGATAQELEAEAYANEHSPSLVVMGSRGLSGARSFILGSVSHYVAQHLSVPVLIVPPEQKDA